MDDRRNRAITLAYEIATLARPTADVLELLAPLPYERTLELLLVLRQSPGTVRSPLNFLRRAITEGWTPETLPEKVDRRTEAREARFYESRGYSAEAAAAKARENRNE